MHLENVDVAIVGAGPVGETLGALLGRRGLKVALFDRWPTLYSLPRAGGVDHEAMRVWQATGVMDCFLEHIRPNLVYPWYGAEGQLLVDIFKDRPEREVSGWHISYQMYQPRLEDALHEVLEEMPNVEVHRGWELTNFSQDDGGVDLQLQGLAVNSASEVQSTGGLKTVRARYMIAADGANSSVRQRLGRTLDDLGFRSDWLIVDSHILPGADRNKFSLAQYCEPTRPYMSTWLGKEHFRFEFMIMPGDDHEALLKPETAYRLMHKHASEADLKIIRQVIYTFRSQIVRDWREKRIIFAGDSVHLMPPKLGQGLCSGVRDAMNLAWKLDLVIREQASDQLLDTYTAERMPHVEAIINLSEYYARLSCTTDPREAQRRDQAYAEGTFASPPFPILSNGIIDTRQEAEHGVVGRLGPQGIIEYAGRRGLADDIVGRGWTVIARDGFLHALEPPQRHLLSKLGAKFIELDGLPEGRGVKDAEGDYAQYLDTYQVSYILVRPDFYVFGAARSTTDFAKVIEELNRQMEHFLQTPTATHVACTGDSEWNRKNTGGSNEV